MKRIILILVVLLGNLGLIYSQSHFSTIWSGNGYDHMNFYVTSATINGINIQTGDELAVFDGSNCVGVGVFSGSYDVRVKASKDDPTTTETDGFIEGHSFTFRMWDESEGTEVTSVSVSVSSGSSTFTGSGTAFVSLTGTVACSGPSAPTIGTITQTTCSEATGSVVLNGLPAGNWTLTRSPGGQTTGSGTSTTISDLAAGTYTFTVTNSLGCTSVASAPVIINTQPVTPAQPGAITGNASVCQSSSPTYSIASVAGATTYTWSLPVGWGGSSTNTSITTTAGASGGTISVTAGNACGTSDASILIVTVTTIPAQPDPMTGETSVCQGSSQTYSIAAVTGATSYTWTMPSGWTGSSTLASITATASANSGNISVKANNSCGSGTARTLAVTVTPLPGQPGTITGNTSVCQGSSQTYSIAAVTGATSYTWTLPAGWNGTSNTTSITATAGSGGGNISVAANNSCGAGTARTLAVTVPAVPAQPGPISGSNSVCEDASETYSIDAVAGATSYTWTLPSGWTGSSNTTSITATVGANAGDITVIANGSCGISSARSLSVTVGSEPEQPGSITGESSVCEGSYQTYSIAAVSDANSYTWTLPEGWNGTSTTTSITTTVGASSGNISVTANNSCGSGTASTLAVATTELPAQPGAITGSASLCAGSVLSYSIAAVAGASSYTWTLPSGWTGTSTSTSITVTAGTSDGNISVTANNGCGSGTARTLGVSVSTTPAQPGTITGNATACQGTSQTYSIASVTGAASYTWALPSGWTGTSTSTSITATAGAGSGNISVKANNTCGSGTARTLGVSVSTTPAQPGTITGNAAACQGTSQTYSIASVTGAASYTWALPSGWTGTSTSTSITATAGAGSGNISVKANNTCGSGTARTLGVSVSTTPAQPGTITGSTTACQGSSQTYSIASVTGAVSYTWTLPSGWTGTSTSTSITATASVSSGNISVKANNTCGSGTARTLGISGIAIPSSPTVGTIEHPTCDIATGSVLLNGLPGSGNWTLTRTPGGLTTMGTGTNVIITGLAAGTYTFTVANESGCASGPSGNVVINAQTEKPATPAITQNGNTLHSDAASGNQWYDQNGLISGATAQDYTPTANGDYHVVVTLEGCSSDPSNTINYVMSAIDQNELNKSVRMYPNPVYDEMIIEMLGNAKFTGYEMMNSKGQVVEKGDILNKTVVNTSGLMPGIYLIKLEGPDGHVINKIVKK